MKNKLFNKIANSLISFVILKNIENSLFEGKKKINSLVIEIN